MIPLKLLLIEDQAPYRENMAEILGFEGYQVLTAESGEEGLAIAEREIPDLVICDLMLPGIDGYEVLRRIRKIPALVDIPFLFLTARVDRMDQRHGMELGADDYLTKPITGSELSKAVSIRLRRFQEQRKAADRRLDDLRHSLADSLPHELLTPLNAIQGFSEMLSLDAETLAPPEIREMADHIREGACRLHRTIRNFLVFANLKMLAQRLEKGAYARGETGEAARVVEGAARRATHVCSREPDLELEVEAGTVTMGAEYLDKIVEELIDNACKFSQPGDKITVQLLFSESSARLTVRDRGRGMTPDEIQRMGAFTQFGRERYEQQGNGLGLALVRELIRIHGGEMLLESGSPGLNVTLTFRPR